MSTQQTQRSQPIDHLQQQQRPINYQQQQPINYQQQPSYQNPQVDYQQPQRRPNTNIQPQISTITTQNKFKNSQPQIPQNQFQSPQNQKQFQPQNGLQTPQNFQGQQLYFQNNQLQEIKNNVKIIPIAQKQKQEYNLEGTGFDPSKYKIKEIKDGPVYRGDPIVQTVNKVEYSGKKIKINQYEFSPPVSQYDERHHGRQLNQPQIQTPNPNQKLQSNKHSVHTQSMSLSPQRQLFQTRRNVAPSISPQRQLIKQRQNIPPPTQRTQSIPPPTNKNQTTLSPNRRVRQPVIFDSPQQVQLVGMLETRLRELIDENALLQLGKPVTLPLEQSENEKLHEQLRIKDIQIMDLKNQWVEQEQENKKNEELIEILRRELEVLQSSAPQNQQLQLMQEQLQQRSEEIEENIKKHGHLHQKIQQHQVEFETHQDEKALLMQRLQHQIEDSQNMENHYLSELEKMKNDAIESQAILMKKLEDYQKKSDLYEVQVADYEDQINFWQIEIERLQQTVSDQEKQLSQWRYKYAQYSHLEDKNIESLQLLVLCQIQMQALTKNVDNTKADLESYRKNHLQTAKNYAVNIQNAIQYSQGSPRRQ